MTRQGACDKITFARKRERNFCVRLAQLDRAFGYGPKGRGFESSNARNKIRQQDRSPAVFSCSGESQFIFIVNKSVLTYNELSR